MPDPVKLKAPSNDEHYVTDRIVVTAPAGQLRALRIAKSTAAINLTVRDSVGNTMAFVTQNPGADGVQQTTGFPRLPGAEWVYTTSPEDPARPRTRAVSWVVFVAGAKDNPVIYVESSFYAGI